MNQGKILKITVLVLSTKKSGVLVGRQALLFGGALFVVRIGRKNYYYKKEELKVLSQRYV
jgi:hypothetical protein